MKAMFEFGDDLAAGRDGQVEVDLPALPRTGQQVLWSDDVPDERGGTYRRLREYRVGRVDWTFSAEEPGDPLVLIRLEFLADVSGAR